jgi:hypothetical protein
MQRAVLLFFVFSWSIQVQASATVTLESLSSRCDVLNIVKIPVDLSDAGNFVRLTFHVIFDSTLTFQSAAPADSLGHGLFTAVPDSRGIRVEVQPQNGATATGTIGALTFILSQPLSSAPLPLYVTEVTLVLQSGGAVSGTGVDGAVTPACAPVSPPLPPRPAFVVQHLAGSADGPGGRDGNGSDARFGSAFGVASLNDGSIVVADKGNFTIRRVTLAGDVTTIAGKAGVAGTADGIGAGARFLNPRDVSLDSSGNIYVLDGDGIFVPARVRRVTQAGLVTTLMGAGADCSADGLATALAFCDAALSLAATPNGDVYVLERARIRRITPGGHVTVVAGSDTAGFRDGVGSVAAFKSFNGSCIVGRDGNLYVYDEGNRAIRRVAADGTTTTIMSGDPLSPGGNVNATGIAVAHDGTIFVRQPSAIIRVTPAGASIIASYDSWCESRMTVTQSGDFVVPIWGGTELARVTASGKISSIAGRAAQGGFVDGLGTLARFRDLRAMTLNPRDRRLYVTDALSESSCTVRVVGQDGSVSTLNTSPFAVCGTDMAALSDGSIVLLDTWQSPNVVTRLTIDGVLTQRRLLDTNSCYDIAVDLHDTIYIPCFDGIRTIEGDAAPRKISSFGAERLLPLANGDIIAVQGCNLYRLRPDGSFFLVAGSGRNTPWQTDGSGRSASFGFITGMTVAPDGGFYVIDVGVGESLLLRHVSLDGTVTTLTGGGFGTEDGPPGVARFAAANKVVADKDGTIFVLDGFAIRVANWSSVGRGRSVVAR